MKVITKFITAVCFFLIIPIQALFGQKGIYRSGYELVSQVEFSSTYTLKVYQSFELYLGNKEYLLSYFNGAFDNYSLTTLSYGRVKKSKDGFVLKDELNGFEMLAEFIDDTTLVFNSGLTCLKDVKLTWTPWNEAWYQSDRSEIISQKDVNRERRKYKRQKNLHVFELGLYGYGRGLILMDDNRYRITYSSEKLVISEGEWSREGNLLAFKDDFMGGKFYALIEEEKMISRFLPGDFVGMDMTKQSELLLKKYMGE